MKRSVLKGKAFIIIAMAAVSACGWLPEKEAEARISFCFAETKAGPVIDTNNFTLTVKGEETTYYDGPYSERPAELSVPAGTYMAIVLSDKFSSPAFDTPVYGDSVVFFVNPGENISVPLFCSLQNCGLTLDFTQRFRKRFQTGNVTLFQNGAKLNYSYDCNQTAYFSPGPVMITASGELIASRTLIRGRIEALTLDTEDANSAAGFTISIEENVPIVRDTATISQRVVLTVAQAKQLSPSDSITAFVSGYVVGGVKSSKVVRAGTPGYDITANILLADSPDDSTMSVCLPVELKSQAIQSALSLAANPSLAGKKVIVKGTILSYFSTIGLKNVSEYEK